MNTEQITFSFGQNWSEFAEGVSQMDISRAVDDIAHWLGEDSVSGKRIVDIGSGSGIHSLSFCKLGAKSVHSFDADPLSVETTRRVRGQVRSPSNWTVEHGSVLDTDYMNGLGTFDIVYSWGVLHHTGAMWEAIDNCMKLVTPGGLLWIALYAKGSRYQQDLALKQRFNASSDLGKRWMIARRVITKMFHRLKKGKNPFTWNEKKHRGMNVYHDIVDWLGGLPYETASADEVVRFARQRGFVLERIQELPEGHLNKYVFSLPPRS